MSRTYYFDLDSALMDLDKVPGAIDKLSKYDPTPFKDAPQKTSVVDMLHEVQDKGHPVIVFTETTNDVLFNQQSMMYKLDWMDAHGIKPMRIIEVPPRKEKYEMAPDRTGILVDGSDDSLGRWFSDKIKVS